MGLFSKRPKAAAGAQLARNVHEAETRYLEVLRRELANLLIAADPELMVRCFEKAEAIEREMKDNPKRATAEEAALVAKFPMFSDFDLIATRHFVPYEDARSSLSDGDLADHYLDVSRMLMFMRRRRVYRPEAPLYDDDERRVLKSSLEREEARRLRQAVDEAMGRFYAFRQGVDRHAGEFAASFEDRDFQVVRLPNDTPEIQFGVACKRTSKYAVFGFYVHETDDLKISNYYYSSDATFRNQKSLSCV